MEHLIAKFCQFEALCYQGEPHWFGWVIIVAVPLGVICAALEGK